MLRTRSVMYILPYCHLHAGQPSLLPVSLTPPPSSFLPSAVLGDKEMVTEQMIPPSLGSYHIIVVIRHFI